MTPIFLLDEIKRFVDDTLKDLLLSVPPRKDNPSPIPRCPAVFKMNLPVPSADEKAAMAKAPYILLQLLTGSDSEASGEWLDSTCTVRIVACVYCDTDGEGSMHVLNVLTRLRTCFLQAGVIGERFELRMPLEYLVYPDNPAPYYLGEMITNWSLPTIRREVIL